MRTTINIPQEKNIQGRIVVQLIDPLSSIESEYDKMRSGFVRISSVERLKREDKNLRKGLKFWMPSISEINMAINNEHKWMNTTYEEFRNVAECFQFIRTCDNKSIILILSQYYGRNTEIVSRFKKLPQIVSLYCCKTDEDFEKLRRKWFIEGRRFARDILPRNVMRIQAKYLDKTSQLLLLQIFLTELLVNLPRSHEAKEDFVMFCHSKYRNDPAYSTAYEEQIEIFNREYDEQKAIEWYTDSSSFVFRIVCETCANLDIVAFFQTRLILHDLFIKLQKLHVEQLGSRLKQGITLYRGKMMLKNELNSIKNNSGLFITRNFLSTSVDRAVAEMYSGDGVLVENEVSVLISMEIDRIEMHDKPIAFIGDCSKIEDENEVMISMGIVFKLHSIEEVYDKSIHSVVIHMIRGEDEKQIEKNLSQFHLVAGTGATCAALGMIPFLISINNDQHIAEYSQLMSDALQSSNPEVAEQLWANVSI